MPIHDAPDFRSGGFILTGDAEVDAFSNVVRLTGLSTGVFSDMPAHTFFANLYDTDGAGRAFAADVIAGVGLSYDLAIGNGQFPEIVFEGSQSLDTLALTYDLEMPSQMLPGDRIVLFTFHNSGTQVVTTPSGFTLLSTLQMSGSEVNVYERILDGSTSDPDTTLTVNWGTSSTMLAYVWQVRHSHTTQASEVVSQFQNTLSDTTNDVGTLTPSWGLASNLWLTAIGIEGDVTSPNITDFPDDFENTGEVQVTGASASDGAIGWGSRQLRATSLNPTSYTYGPQRSSAFLIAVPPRPAGAFNLESIAAKSVLANATNATGRPAALAGSAAFQHLRVNAANTGLEWSLLTSGDFPAGVVPLTAIATQATDTLVANITAGTATPVAVPFTSIDSASLIWDPTSHTFQTAAVTGAVTIAQNGTVAAFGALAAKSVLANATNASAVPAALAGSAAFQHLRVNAANTGLEWSLLTSGDFPAGVVPLTAIATQAANTVVANATAGVASPTAFVVSAESVLGRTSGNFVNITSSLQSILMRSSGSVFWGTAAADQVLRRSGSGDLGFGTLVTNNIGDDQITNPKLANMATLTIKSNMTGVSADPADNTIQTILNSTLSSAVRRFAVRQDNGTWAGIGQRDVAEYLSLPDSNDNAAIVWTDDHFNGITASTGALGTTSARIGPGHTPWSVSSNPGVGALSELAHQIGHVGCVQMLTGANSGDETALYITSAAVGDGSATAVLSIDHVVVADFWVRPSNITSRAIRVGFGSSIFATALGANSLYFEFSSAGDASWTCHARSSSTSASAIDSGVDVAAATWYKLTIRRISSANIQFYINNILVGTHVTNIPTAVDLLPAVWIGALAAGARGVDIDRVRILVDEDALLS